MPRRAMSAIQQQILGNPNNKTKKELRKRAKYEKKLNFEADKLKPTITLSTSAKKVFNSIVETYAGTTFLNNLDANVLSRYCDLISEYVACNNRLKKNGRSKDGKISGDLRFKLNLSSELGKLEKELGLTPAARASLAIGMANSEEEEEKDDFDEDFTINGPKAVK